MQLLFVRAVLNVANGLRIDIDGVDHAGVPDALGGSYREPSGSGTDVGDGFSRTNCQNIHDAVDLKTLVPARRIENREIPGVRLAGSTVLGWSLRRRRWILPANGYGSVQAEKQGLNTKATFEHGRRLQGDCFL